MSEIKLEVLLNKPKTLALFLKNHIDVHIYALLDVDCW